MRVAALILVAAVTAVCADFLDDFESYTPGQDPDESFNWMREPTGGHVLVVEQGENQVVQAFFPDSAYIGYVCSGAGFWDDGSVAMDFSATGSGMLMNVFCRMQITTGDLYVGGVVVFLQPFTYAYIAYVNPMGEYELLYNGYGPTVTPDTWVNVKLLAEGEDPVTLTLFANGQQMGQATDTQYRLGAGLSGFAFLFEGDTPLIHADNFQVLLGPQGLIPSAWGTLKGLFL